MSKLPPARTLQRSVGQKKAANKTKVVYVEDLRDFDAMITTLRLALVNEPKMSNKRFAQIVKQMINGGQYGTSKEVLETLGILYLARNPLKYFHSLNEIALREDANAKEVVIENDDEE
ncbi:hypothetical protein YOLOSWAG_286 [Erwinia phage vB_EamM_Yoloswag]|uniref:Uncharacterized protein n=1 Tax=Erwinia phage vB_EamM_Yoloswag TaxID=1958956 RepID=A0A1S6L3K5_9CAUD|nr:hypothetical protein HOR66_gp286 [Erwinia phage vB_EamM_Yoloswag]AQT28757.1 hypothetical protein YOLOSWAG_286 [Erwinia phage vB_EamM_Yoloswag]